MNCRWACCIDQRALLDRPSGIASKHGTSATISYTRQELPSPVALIHLALDLGLLVCLGCHGHTHGRLLRRQLRVEGDGGGVERVAG